MDGAAQCRAGCAGMRGDGLIAFFAPSAASLPPTTERRSRRSVCRCRENGGKWLRRSGCPLSFEGTGFG